MKKDIFFISLNSKLVFDLPFSEIKKINSEYNGYFSEGIKSGKNEEQIINEIGTPSLVATEILSEKGNLYAGEIQHKMLRLIGVIILILLALVFSRQFNLNFGTQASEQISFTAFAFVLPTILFFILGGQKLVTTKSKSTCNGKLIYLINGIVFLMVWLMPTYFTNFIMIDFVNGNQNFLINLLHINHPYDIGPWMSNIFILLEIITLAMIFIIAVATLKSGRTFVPLIYINAVLLYGMLRYLQLLYAMDDPNAVIPAFRDAGFIVLTVSVIFVLLFTAIYFALKAVSRRRGK